MMMMMIVVVMVVMMVVVVMMMVMVVVVVIIDVKCGLLIWGRHVSYNRLEAKCWGKYLDLEGWNKWNFMIYVMN